MPWPGLSITESYRGSYCAKELPKASDAYVAAKAGSRDVWARR